MKVAVLTYRAQAGAFATIARNIARGMADLDVDVDVLYLAGPPPTQITDYPPGSHLVRLGGRGRSCWPRLARQLRTSRPDALISLGWILNPAAVVGTLMSLTKVPVILNEASLLSYKTRTEHRHQPNLRVLDHLARLLYPRAAAITGASSAIVDDLVSAIGLDPVDNVLRVVPYSVDSAEVVRRSRPSADTVDGPGPVFVNVARHARQKNLTLLLRAFSRYLAHGGSGTLVLVGVGPQTENLRRLASELRINGHVIFRGHLENPFPQMAAASAFVLSSEEEGFGLVLVEAMALGVPVISTDCPGGPREILRDGDAGLLIPPNDEPALAEAMRQIAADPALRFRLVRAGYARARDFSPPAVARLWLDLISDVLPTSDVLPPSNAVPNEMIENQTEATSPDADEDRPIAMSGVDHYYPRAFVGDGGVTNAVWLWAATLARAGDDVRVLYDNRTARLPRFRLPNGVRVRGVAHLGRGRWCLPRRLSAELDSDRLLVLHSGYVLANLVAAAMASRSGVGYLVVPHGAYDSHIRTRRRPLRAWWERAERLMLEGAVAVHVFFESERDQIAELAPEARLIVAATPYDPPETAWGLGEAEQYIAWIGRYDIQHKGLDRLFDAMASLPKSARPVLRLHGRDSTNSREDVQRLVDERGLNDNVTVGAPLAGAEKSHFLLRARGYVHPSRWESYGLALVEGLALGLPTLVTADIAIAESLRTSDAAFVVDGSIRGLRDGLLRLAAPDVAAVATRGRTFVMDTLSHEAAGIRWHTELKKLITAAGAT